MKMSEKVHDHHPSKTQEEKKTLLDRLPIEVSFFICLGGIYVSYMVKIESEMIVSVLKLMFVQLHCLLLFQFFNFEIYLFIFYSLF